MILFGKKATMELNNMGVSLLYRGCLRQAIETFTDALAVAQLFCRTKHNIFMNYNDRLASPTLFTQYDSVDVRKILEKAFDRLSQPKPSTLCGIELEVISDDDNLASIHSRCLIEETDSSLNVRKENFVIQMDHLNVNILSEEEDDMANQCSIICYNYGVAYLCLSALPASSPYVNQLYMGALKMFQLAWSTLTACYYLKKEKLQSYQTNRALITGLLVLRNLILLSSTLGMAKERDEYLQCLGDLKQSIHEFCDFHHVVSSPRARAA